MLRPSLGAHGDARLVGRISLAYAAVCAATIVFAAPFAPAALAAVLRPVLGIAIVGYGLAYLLARTGAYRLALGLTLLFQAQTPLLVGAQLGTATELDTIARGEWLAIPVLTAATLGSWRIVMRTGIAILLAFIGSSALDGALRFSWQPVVFLLAVATIVAITARHRERLEALRQRELRENNEALEGLRQTLERRVAERTVDLERSTAELSRANEALHANQAALLATETMAAIGRLTAGIAHEMSSPLSALLAATADLERLASEYAESIGDPSVSDDDHREIAREMRTALELATQGATRSVNFVRSVKAQTRVSGNDTREPFDLVGAVRDATNLVGHAARAARCRIALEASTPSLEHFGDPSRLAQAITNLLLNAIDATGERGGGDVEIRIEHAEEIVLSMRDTGMGIRPDVLPRIFEPLFTTKPYGRGTGLGLAIVKEIVEQDFGGRVGVTSTFGEGTTFQLHLPRLHGGSRA